MDQKGLNMLRMARPKEVADPTKAVVDGETLALPCFL